ncbi:leucine-rich repeat-containing protein [Lasius niger]|uniref:Leucine-rich repeat-containing protein n=1 Tax=Lasius niger TaxID=67767 RepID=A0A0J7KUW7_LASNI|nr:leucine-rich repeat-containing protein [Lasius niger]
MVLSDLDQIKKNERDRRRRLRLEQVRQQSKEISNRLLERAKKIAREELSKLEKDGRSELKQMHDRKIMDIQQKYQEDLEDIGQAHALAALQPDANIIIEEEERKDRAMALKRGKDAIECMKEAKQKDSAEAAHQERLRKVREIENTRAAMIAKLPKSMSPEEHKRMNTSSSQEDTNEEIVHETLTPKRKSKKILPKKSPRKMKKSNLKEYQKTSSPKPGPSGLQKQSVIQSHKSSSKKKGDKIDHIEYITNDVSDDQLPRRTVPVISTTPTEAEKVARYNPEDYTQNMSDSASSISSSSSNSTSDDSSYFSDITEQIICNKTPRTSLTESKVRLYDHNMRQRNVYSRPSGIVERIDIRNEPNAIEAAQAIKDAENVKTYISESRKLNAQRRGEDAILREKVRRDYQALIQNLNHLAQEERRLKASQVQSAEESTHTRLHQRNKCQEEHQKKLNRAAKKIFDTTGAGPAQYSHLAERVITLPTQKKDNTVPHSTWQEPHLVDEETDVCHTQRDKDSEMSREEQILDMLKKVERQKRLLLQEFGASLPDDIFNISMKPVFEDKTQIKARKAAKPLSPEIKVINMSNSDECIKRDRKARKPDKSPAKKIEIAVQAELDKAGPAENKSIQVELPRRDTDISLSGKDATARIPHPIEPKITIITPETDDSSNDSTSSEVSGMVIEIDKKEVVVTPKRRKSSVRISKRLSPRIYQKIRSTSVSSKATSPMKRFSRSQSGTRLTSPHKKTKCLDAPVDTASRRVDIHVSKSAFTDETDPSQETRVSIDASAESSQTFSGMNDQEQTSSQPYRIRTQMKRWIRIKDTSDTSTSFASPPPIKPKSMFETLTNVTPILEMLDTPGPEELRRLRQEVSPVSTPETPSPRTMMMPSNIPHRDRISRMLRYNMNDSQTNDSTIISSMQKDQSTLTDPSDTCQRKSSVSEYLLTPTQQPSISSKVCICKNPECKLLHTKLDDIHDYALKNCPEILQKYEDLQNLCAERIASLTDLIEKVRSEQKGMDFSLISPSDETSLMQLPTSRPAREDAQTVHRLIESIEAIHAQLARTLLESQRIVGSDAVPRDEPSCDTEVQAITSTPRSKSLDTVKAHIQKSEQRPQATSATKMSDRNSWPPCTFSLHEEEVIEKLSKEILEQSKNMDKASIVSRGADEISMQHKMSSFKNIGLKNNTSLEYEKDNSISKEVTSTQEVTKENDFIPILAGIPKISRNHGIVTSISTRPKPPVTLLNGPYRPELESSGHELSTIVEFDTTDTANKSIKSPAKSKPSVHVAPLPIQQNQYSSEKPPTSSVKHSAEKLIYAQRLQETTTICKSPAKLKSTADGTTIKIEAEQEYMPEKCNKQLQCNTTTEEPISQAKDKLGSSISTDFNNPYKDSKHKTTSTSLYSFSGLSGISEITSSPSSDILKHASSPEEMETALKKLGLGWAVTTLKKTREASALSSSSNSDVTPINTARRMISPTKKQHDPSGLPDISDVSSISIKEASKSTEQAVLLKGRTSTPKFQNSNSNSERSTTTNTSESIQDPSDSLTVPNVSLTKTKSDNKQQNL